MVDFGLTQLVLASGALGTASFGIVDALKSLPRFSLIGMGRIGTGLSFLNPALEVAYGNNYSELLKAQFRDGRSKGDLPRTLRQGTRIGLTPETAPGLAIAVGVVQPDDLAGVAGLVQNGHELDTAQRAVLARFEMALDARINAQLALAESDHKAGMRLTAAVIALGFALIGGSNLARIIHAGQPI